MSISDYSDIISGLRVNTQIPLDVKLYSPSETDLANLGTNNNLAFTYVKGMIVYCVNEETRWEWRSPAYSGEQGLMDNDFIYPTGVTVFGILYGDRHFNFFKVDHANKSDIKQVISNGGITVNETDTQIILSVDGSETKINAGNNITKTGLGTTASPYVITANIRNYVQAGSNTTVTGTGTIGDPYIISANNDIGWLRGDTKEIVCDATYLSNNFETSGLGKNERLGWAIMNGATHGSYTVPNDNGKVVVAYGTSYPTLGATGGSKDAVVVEHNHGTIPLSNINDGASGGGTVFGHTARWDTGSGAYNDVLILSSGESGVNKNMQPYVVRLRIIKL